MGMSRVRWGRARRAGLSANVKGWAGWVLESLAVMSFIGLITALAVGLVC